MKHLPVRLRPLFMAPAAEPTEGASGDLRRNLHLVAVHGIFGSAALSMVGPFTAIFAMKIGASQLHVALLTSGPAVVSLLAMIPGARVIDRSDRRKRLTARFVLAQRVFYLALACVPFFPGPARPVAFVALLAVMNLPGAIGNVAWQAFSARVVPPEHRAAAFAARSRLVSVAGTSIALVMGLFLDRVAFPAGYQIAFVGAFLLSLAELAVFRGMREPGAARTPPAARPSGNPVLGGIRRVLGERRFVRYTLVSMLFYLAWQIPWPLFSWYQVRVLHANNFWVSLLALINTGGAVVGYGFWSRFIERWGNLRALFAATLPIFLICVVYAFSDQLYTIAAANLMMGAIFSGVNIALLNTLFEMTPDDRKTSYIAYFNTAVTVSSIIAPLIGVALIQFLSFRAAFLVAAAIRIAGSLCYYALYRTERREGRVPGGDSSLRAA